MIELFLHHVASPYVRKILLVSHESGIELTENQVDYSSEQAMRDYRQLNPTGKFPTLRDGDVVLRESNAIMVYLAECQPDAGLYGSDARERARIGQWLFWELAHFAETIHPYAAMRMGYPSRTSMTEEALADEFAEQCALIDAQLEGADFLVGERLSVADLAVAADLSYIEEAGLTLGGYKNLDRWFASIRERESWRVTEARKREALATG